jgi:hypothetical protein
MNSLSTVNNFKEDLNFNFNTTYMGNEITLHVISNSGRYSVLHNDKPIGYIKLGDVRHTWYVVDSHYAPPYLVDEIGNRIEAQLQAPHLHLN